MGNSSSAKLVLINGGLAQVQNLFQESNLVTLVFIRERCRYCAELTPILANSSKNLIVGIINIDIPANADLVRMFNVRQMKKNRFLKCHQCTWLRGRQGKSSSHFSVVMKTKSKRWLSWAAQLFYNLFILLNLQNRRQCWNALLDILLLWVNPWQPLTQTTNTPVISVK